MRGRVVDEKRLRFSFDQSWLVCRWDKDECQKGFHLLKSTRAIDIIGLVGSRPFFIEITDYRGYSAKARHGRHSGELASEVAEKVRDSLAGLIWSVRRDGVDPGDLAQFVTAIIRADEKPFVALWLEEDELSPVDAKTLGDDIKKLLRPWLSARVVVLNRTIARERSNPIPGLVVTDLPSLRGPSI